MPAFENCGTGTGSWLVSESAFDAEPTKFLKLIVRLPASVASCLAPYSRLLKFLHTLMPTGPVVENERPAWQIS